MFDPRTSCEERDTIVGLSDNGVSQCERSAGTPAVNISVEATSTPSSVGVMCDENVIIRVCWISNTLCENEDQIGTIVIARLGVIRRKELMQMMAAMTVTTQWHATLASGATITYITEFMGVRR